MINLNNPYTYLIFIIGVFIGSFLNVVIYRLPRELNFVKGRSMCANCEHTLYWYDLFPLLSYLFLGGKCRYCKEKISIQYPLVEFTTGLIFTLIYSYIMKHNGSIEIHHLILFIIACFAIIGIFTDFLYHGTFDFSTLWICGLLFVYLLIIQKDILYSFKTLLSSLSYIVPIAFVVIYITLKSKKRMFLAVLSLILMIVVSIFSLSNFEFYIDSTLFLINSFINWISISLLIFITDYIIKKLITSSKIKSILCNLLTYLNFILFFIFLFNPSEAIFSTDVFKETLSLNFKNIILIILFSLFYKFMLEMFEAHDNNEEILDNNEEIIDRDENIFTQYIGDGDLFTLPFIGMLLGYANVFNFYVILGFTIISVYSLIFKKGLNYSVPLYPFIMLAIFVLL